MGTPVRVLIIDDSPVAEAVLLRELARHDLEVESRRADSRDTLLAALDAGPWDVALCDYYMPGFTGLDVLQELRGRALDIPVILVSGSVNEEMVQGALTSGAQDFVSKGGLARLVPAIFRELRASTERRLRAAAARELEDQSALLRHLDESNFVAIAECDAEGCILDANDTFLKLLGLTREHLARRPRWDSLVPPEQRPRIDWAMEELRSVGKAGPWEMEVLRTDGSRVAVMVGGSQREAETGRAICFLLDISARRQVEQDLRRREAELLHAQRLESIGLLAGGIAHDFNNVLQAILGHAEILVGRSMKGSADERDILEIRRAGERAGGLTRQLLAFSRRQVLHPKVIDLNAVVRDLEKMLRRLLDERIEFVLRLAPDPGLVKADPAQMEQVVMNLVVNARDAMPNGGTLTIETMNRDPGGNPTGGLSSGEVAEGASVEVAVRDTGCGMDAETQSRIFDPFFTTKEAGKGTGLGLSTVYGIVKQSSGRVAVESEVGRGSVFRVILPATAEPRAPEVAPSSAPAPKSRGERILVVEDDALVREIVKEMVERLGYPVISAGEPMEALQLSGSRRNPVSLLLTDIVMPKMSGPQLYEQLHRLYPDLRVLYMSGYASAGAIQEGVLSSGVKWLQKPFTMEALAVRLREVLDGG